MTFDDWWKRTVREYEIPQDQMFSLLVRVIAQTAWNEGFSDGCKETSQRFGTRKPDNDNIDTGDSA